MTSQRTGTCLRRSEFMALVELIFHVDTIFLLVILSSLSSLSTTLTPSKVRYGVICSVYQTHWKPVVAMRCNLLRCCSVSSIESFVLKSVALVGCSPKSCFLLACLSTCGQCGTFHRILDCSADAVTAPINK